MEFNKRRHVFIVSIECAEILEPTVVHNYVQMAIKKFDKMVYKEQRLSYFDGLWATPSFYVKEIAVPKDSDGKVVKEDLIREMVRIAKTASDSVEEMIPVD